MARLAANADSNWLASGPALALALGLAAAALAPVQSAMAEPQAKEAVAQETAGGEVSASGRILVEVDRAQLLRLEEPAGSVIIGNPMIADAAIHDHKMLVITGKSFGTTNLIILDSAGREIYSKTLEVRIGSQSVVTMHKGAARQSYSCSPVCEPALLSGDSKEYFESVRDQIVSRIDSSAASGSNKTR